MDWMTIVEIALGILLAEALLTAVRWARQRRAATTEEPAPGYGSPPAFR